MLKRLLDTKSFCKELEETMPDLKLSNDDWDKIASMVCVYSYCKKVDI